MNIQHSSKTDSWGTPVDIIESVYAVLGGIDLDPASSPEFNKVVGATKIFTKEDNALSRDWANKYDPRTVFLNPPGGKIGNRSNTELFWAKLMSEHRELAHAIFVGFSLECMQVTQRGDLSVLDFPICVPRKRLRFNQENGLPGKAPSHSNVIVYVPGRYDCTEQFIKEFSKYGKCKK